MLGATGCKIKEQNYSISLYHIHTYKCKSNISVPGYLLTVCGPVPDVLLLLFHAMFEHHAPRAGHGAGAWGGGCAEP